jgi:hypothetical protein
VRRETYQYGKTDRHKVYLYNPTRTIPYKGIPQLDIYYPEPASIPTNPDGSPQKLPIIFFSYLGGLEFGDRILPESDGLVYRNFGAFFTRQGFVVVVADYRLVPTSKGGAVYPDCLDDIFDALCFLTSDHASFGPNSTVNEGVASGNTEEGGKQAYAFRDVGDIDRIFLLAHSAGALNQSSLILHPTIMPASHPLRRRIKGAIWNGGAYHFENPYSMPIEEYYGPTASGGHLRNSSLGLLRSASEEILRTLPPLFIISAEWENEKMFWMVKDFVRVLKERCGPGSKTEVELTEYMNMGHNHISSYLSLMSGEGEEWGYEVVRWIRSHM